jgi:hypothetical protein
MRRYRPPDSDGRRPVAIRVHEPPPDAPAYFYHELVLTLFPRNPHHLIMAKQRCALTSPVPVLTQHS